ncbi:MAG: DUF2127 domain-containing protein [Patescibacteria group bacterium]|nr:DUF2127 domain-containing protein [Patescibacteria group bacterium]
MEETPQERKLFHELFEITILIKAVYGVLEILLGIVILFFSRHLITYLLLHLVQGELGEDPENWLAKQIVHFSSQITSSSELFVGIYFFAGGAIKTIYISGLLLGRAWAYPAAIVCMALFAIYELYRITQTHSIVLMIFTALDILTILLVWHEYRNKYIKP